MRVPYLKMAVFMQRSILIAIKPTVAKSSVQNPLSLEKQNCSYKLYAITIGLNIILYKILIKLIEDLSYIASILKIMKRMKQESQMSLNKESGEITGIFSAK